MKSLGKLVCDRGKWQTLQYKWALQAHLSVFYANSRLHTYSYIYFGIYILGHTSNPLDSFVLVQGQYRQAEVPFFDTCLY